MRARVPWDDCGRELGECEDEEETELERECTAAAALAGWWWWGRKSKGRLAAIM